MNSIPNAVNYKYNVIKHLEHYIADTFNNKDENIETSYKIQTNVLEEIKNQIKEKGITSLKNFNKILTKYEYKKHKKDILRILNYKIPILSDEDKIKIINHFKNNKVKFSRFKNGKAPFKSFYDICEESMDDLGIKNTLKLEKVEDNIENLDSINETGENYLITKKNQ